MINTVVVYITIMVVILATQPSWLFDKQNNLKQFGQGNDSTYIPLPVLSMLVAIVTFILIKSAEKSVKN
jgi:amino acid permease